MISSWTWRTPSAMPRDASKRPQITSSFTAFALAPGVLKTGIPISVILSTGMLLVPAPQRAMARTLDSTSSSCSLCERSKMAWGLESPPCSTICACLRRGQVNTVWLAAGLHSKSKLLLINGTNLVLPLWKSVQTRGRNCIKGLHIKRRTIVSIITCWTRSRNLQSARLAVLSPRPTQIPLQHAPFPAPWLP